jgi:hypothetical protein
MSWPARTICGCLDDMRNCYKTYNFQAIASLIEEVQMLANRMEAHLDTTQSYEAARNELRKINEELKKAKKKRKQKES